MATALRGEGIRSYLRYGLGFLIAFGFLVIALWSYPQMAKNFAAIQQANLGQLNLRILLSLMQDMETGQRGFVLTGNEAYLEPYAQAKQEFEASFARLAREAEGDTQRARLEVLRDLSAKKLDELEAIIALRRTEGFDGALRRVNTDVGKKVMDQIRVAVADGEAEERGKFEKLVQIGGQFSLIMMASMGGATLALVVTGLLIFLMLRRHMAERAALLEKSEHNVEALQVSNVALARANEELQHFAYVASHDLQEPLRSISGYVQLLARRYAGELDEKALGYIDKAHAASLRMQALIDDLLAYTRVSTQARSFEEVSTGRVLTEILANLAASIEESGAVVHYQHLPTIWGDRVQVSQLFQNLIGNALKFRGGHAAEVWIDVVPEPGGSQDSTVAGPRRWLFSVRDNGIGIAPEFQSRLFKVFQRLHTRQEYPGTGIGLAICKRIVERHGGRIWLTSEPGEGTTFFFTLPALVQRNA